MKQSFRKFISSTLTLVMTIGLAGLGASTASAAQLTNNTVTLSDSRQNQNANYTIVLHAASTTSLKKVSFQFAQNASTNGNLPSGLDTTSATVTSVDFPGSANDTSNWTLDASTTPGTLLYTATSATGSLTASDTMTFVTAGVHNNTTTGGSLCDTVTDSETCWIRVTTIAADGTTTVDTATLTYTVVNSVQVTATVDPILTFTVAGVSSATTPDSNAGATSITSTATTVPFGNVTLGTAKVASQSLTVLTNANNGYNVYNKFLGTTPSTDLMTGTYSGNNVDPFAGNSAAWAEDSGTPGTWTTPTGSTKNVDTAWLGIRTNNGSVSGFNSSDKWAPPYVGSSIGKKVMVSSGPDNGATPTYVSFKIQANAYQPSDTYTGTTVYNVVAAY